MYNQAPEDVFTFLDDNDLNDPPYFADYSRFLVREMQGFGWRNIDGPDIDPMDDYMQHSFQKVLDNPISPQLALNHGGHGINSYGLNLRMQVGGVLIVAQYGWGGGYMDSAKQRNAWNAGMDALHEFFNEIDLNIDIFSSPEPRDLDVAVRFSEFRGSPLAVFRDDSGAWQDVDLKRCRHLQDVMDVVLENETDSWGLF